jgi:DNA polymerase-1
MTLIERDDLEIFKTWLRRQKILVVDTETNVVEHDHQRFLVGISFYAPESLPWYLPIGHIPFAGMVPDNIEDFDFSAFLRRDVTLIFHNAKFDLKVLKASGIDLYWADTVDTMLWHHLVDQYRPHDLGSLEKNLLKKDEKSKLLSAIKPFMKDFGYEAVPPVMMAKYAENDVVSTWELYEYLLPLMEQANLLEVWKTDQQFMKLLAKLETSGLKLDRPLAQRYTEESKARMAEIRDALPFDPSKDVQVRNRFFGELPHGLALKPTKLTPGGKASVDEDALTTINHPEAGLLLEFRGLQKATSTWYLGFQEKADMAGYLHPEFKMHGTVTHRLSASNPNPQQIPRDGLVKGLFLPEEGCDLIEFDYRAVEFRLATVYGGVDSLLEVFRNNGDVHTAVAERLGIPRFIAKNTNFCIIYGGGAGRIAETAGISVGTAREVYDEYRKEYSGLFEISARCESLARQRGFIKYWDGRRRVFKYDYEYRKAFNSVIQGGAFQIIKRSMLELDRRGYDIRNQVHDSIWINLPKHADRTPIESVMVDWTVEQFGIPFHVESKVLHA